MHMLAEVFAFALVMSVFEFVILVMVPPRLRLRLLGNDISKTICHVGFLLLNLWVHWGTVVGTMSSTLSFITSMAVLGASTRLFGTVTDGRYYTVGWIKYSTKELQ
jgi:multisubunit Na+/H+ antiporter MnhF subunit